jgi:hypothetical protein
LIFISTKRDMTPEALENLKFPIGKYRKVESLSSEIIQDYILDIAAFPARLRQEVAHLDEAQLDTPYRPEGWTIRQVVHHCADSHINSVIRFKLALTEENPTIKPYHEERWAELADGKAMPIEPSLIILQGLHERWVTLLQSLSESDLKKTFIHPEHGKSFRLDETIGIYAWHGNHHLAHITSLKSRMQWK